MKPDLHDLEFPVFTVENPPLEPPKMSLEEWIVWLEEARKLQAPEALQAWLREPLPQGRRFELLD